MPRFELKRNQDGKFMFKLKSIEREVILVSAVFDTKEACKNAIEAVRKYADNYTMYKRTQSKDGANSFELTSAEGEVIGTSEIYARSVVMERAIQAVVKVAKWAKIEDKSLE